MNWCKLSLLQINEFLVMYQEPEEVIFSKAVIRAESIFPKICWESDPVTIPIRNLHIASTIVITTNHRDISNLRGWKLTQFAQTLGINAPESNIVIILSYADLLVDDIKLSSLPRDLLRTIALNTDYDDLINYHQVNKELYNIVTNFIFWGIKYIMISVIYHQKNLPKLTFGWQAIIIIQLKDPG